MLTYSDININELSLHFVGNKANEEILILSNKPMHINDEIKDMLKKYFLKPFKSEEFFNLFHEDDITQNIIFRSVSEIFETPVSFHEQSKKIASHLFDNSIHPNIKSGEFYVVHFTDINLNNEIFEAVGLFKSENKDTFLKIKEINEKFNIEFDKGININKLDKGCLIFNSEKENGYIVSIIDNTNKSSDAQYWADDFLQITQRKDAYFNTQNILTLCKDFVVNELPQQFEVSKADQIDLLNKSVKYFKENEDFDLNKYASEVIGNKEAIDSFNNYKTNFQNEYDIEIIDNFSISPSAVKKQSKVFKSIIKLDKNFHIYIHGNRELIEQGVDESGRKYYKIYYNEES